MFRSRNEDTIAHYQRHYCDTLKNYVFINRGDLDHHETEIDFDSGMKT